MLRKRRFFRRRPVGRRRQRFETRTATVCRTTTNIFQDATCQNPIVEAFLLIAPNQLDSPSDPFPLIPPSGRGVSVAGIKFESSYFIDPSTATDAQAQCDPSPFDLAFFVTIWEAIVVLPLQQGIFQGGAAPPPTYLPIFPNPVDQGNDFADRVLWKRQLTLPYWGLNVSGGFPQLTSSQIFWKDQSVTVKSKVFLDDKHGLFYVRNFVHDIALGGPFVDCTIPVFADAWVKMWYKARL